MADGDRVILPNDTFLPSTDDIHDLSEFLPSISSSSSTNSGLDSISTQFKGILMDLHDSMMPTTPSPPNGDVQITQETIPFLEDVGKEEEAEEIVGSTSFNNSKLGANFDITSVATLPVHAPPPDAINDFTDDLEMGDVALNSFDNFTSDTSAAQLNEDNYATLESEEATTQPENGEGKDDDAKLNEELTLDLKPSSPGVRIKLHVSKLPTGFKEEHIANLFEPFGTVVECELFPYKNFAYVHLDNEAGGLEAIKMLNKIKLNGQNITVMKSKLETKVKVPSSSAQEETVATYKIYFSFLQPNLTKDFVTSLVQEYGRIVDIEIYRSNSAFVHMEEEEAGIRVIKELNGKVIPECERPLDVSLSKNPEGPRIPVVRLQVRNLPEDLSANQIRSLFQPYGLVVSTTLTKSKFDPLRKAVVQLEQLGDIRSAIKDLGEMEFNGKKLLVEALLETPPIVHPTPSSSSSTTSSTSSKKKKKRGGGPNNFSPLRPPPIPPMLPPMRVKPEYYPDDGYHPYDDFSPPPPMFRGGGPGPRMGMRPPMFHRPPMMMQTERIARDRPPQHMLPPALFGGGGPRGPRGGNFRGGRGGGGNGMPNNMSQGPRPPFGPRFPKRSFPPHFPPPPEEYDFDTYYQDPSAVSARDHYAPHLEDEYDSYTQQIRPNFSSPPQKKSRGGGAGGGGRGGGGRGNARPSGNNLPTLMPSSFNPFAEDDDYLSTTQPPTLQLSLGEREYFPPGRGRGRGGRGGGNATIQQQRHATQQAQVESFQAKQLMAAAGYGPSSSSQSNYLATEQIPGSSFPPDDPSIFQEDSYFDTPHTINGTFNAIPFDYSNLKQKRNGNQNVTKRGGGGGGAPAGRGGGMGRGGTRGGGAGNRGGGGGGAKNKKKARHPGLGASKGGAANQINPNEMPLGGGGGGGGFGPGAGTFSGGRGGGGGAGPSNNSGARGGGGGRGGRGRGGVQTARYKTKEQAKNENIEYADFLAKKSWLHQAIPGVVRPAQR